MYIYIYLSGKGLNLQTYKDNFQYMYVYCDWSIKQNRNW